MPDYKEEDFLALVKAIHHNDTPQIIILTQNASDIMLQSLVDVGDSMKRIGFSEATNRGINLFTAFKTMLLIPKERIE